MAIDPLRGNGIPEQQILSSASTPSFGLPSFKDTLSSLGTVVTTSLFVMFTFVAMKALSFVLNIKPDFTNLTALKKQFANNPRFVIEGILSLIHTNPTKAKKILMKVIEDWKDHPQDYTRYSRDRNRKELISAIDDLIYQCCLSKEERDLCEKITNGELEEDEAFAISVSEDKWNGSNSTKRAAEARQTYKKIEEKKQHFKELLWGGAVAILEETHPEFIHSNFNSDAKNPLKNKERSFGLLIERFIYDHDLKILKNNEIFNSFIGHVDTFIQHLIDKQWSERRQGKSSFAELKKPLEILHAILSDKTKCFAFWELANDLIAASGFDSHP